LQLEKSIKFENTNQYKIETNIINKVKTTWVGTIIDFIDNLFISGSWSPMYWFTNNTAEGEILGWNKTLVNLNNTNISYSVSGIGDYKAKNNYVVGLK